MKKCLFVVSNEAGHLLPAVCIADELRKAGIRSSFVIFAPDFESFVADRGYGVVKMSPLPVRIAGDSLAHIAIAVARLNGHLARSLPEVTNLEDWDLIITDAILVGATYAVLRAGRRPVVCNTGFPYSRERGVPPLTSRAEPMPTLLGALRLRHTWATTILKRLLIEERMARAFPRAQRQALDILSYRVWRRKLDKLPDAPRTRRADVVVLPWFEGLPEVICCSELLDFRRPRRAERYYGGLCVDLTRPEPPAEPPATWAAQDAPVVFAGFGTHADRYLRKGHRRFLEQLLGVARRRPDLKFVLQAGVPCDDFEIPGNVWSLEFTPQITLLKQASLFIGHGGLGSIKEALACGVPVLAVPFVFDQPGNGARLRYHGIGDWIDPRCDGASLEDVVEKLLSPAARQRVASFQTEVVASSQRELAATVEFLRSYCR